MFKDLFNKNPLLKVLVPILMVCVVGLLFIRFFKPLLTYREDLLSKATALNNELSNISKIASSLSANDKQRMEEQLKRMRDNLGLSLFSPELVRILEEKAGQTGIKIQNYSFDDASTKDGLQGRKLKLVILGSFTAILNFEKSLEEFPPFTGTENIAIKPLSNQDTKNPAPPRTKGASKSTTTGGAGVQPNGQELEATLTLGFSSVPEAYVKIESSQLPVRENPFR